MQGLWTVWVHVGGADMGTEKGSVISRDGSEESWPPTGSRGDFDHEVVMTVYANSHRMFTKEWISLCVNPASINLTPTRDEKQQATEPPEDPSFQPSDGQNETRLEKETWRRRKTTRRWCASRRLASLPRVWLSGRGISWSERLGGCWTVGDPGAPWRIKESGQTTVAGADGKAYFLGSGCLCPEH